MLNNIRKKEITKEQINELQNILVQVSIDFLNSHNLNDVDEIDFTVDHLQDSRRYRKWVPATDSTLQLVGIEDGERKLIDYIM